MGDELNVLVSDRTIPKIREICTNITKEWVPKFKEHLTVYAQFRGVPVEVFKDTDLFEFDDADGIVNIDDKATDLNTLQGRVIFPIKDCNGMVMGFSGYNPEKSPKYLDTLTYGYMPRFSTFYGLELIKKYLEDNKAGIPLFITEGIVDCLIIRYLGFNCISLLGSNMNKIVDEIMTYTFGYYIADNDDNKTGEKFVLNSIRRHKSYISYIYKNKYRKNGELDLKVKDTNDAYIIWGEGKLKSVFEGIKNFIYFKNDIMESI